MSTRRARSRGPGRSASHANRGQGLESVLDDLHLLYARRGVACIDRTPHPMRKVGVHDEDKGVFLAVNEGKGPQDYRGSVAPWGLSVVFDAKDCQSRRWDLKLLEEHQAKRLDLAARTGAFAFILLRHRGRMHVLPWSALGPRWWAWKRTPGRAKPGTASLSAEDLRSIGHRCDAGGWLPVVRRLLTTEAAHDR